MRESQNSSWFVDVEATAARYSAEAFAARTMVTRTRAVFGLTVAALGADRAYGNGAFDEFTGLPLLAGRFYGDAEVAFAAPVVVLGHRLAAELAAPHDALWLLGRAVQLGPGRGETRTVVGVLAPPPGTSAADPEPDLVAFAPLRGYRLGRGTPVGRAGHRYGVHRRPNSSEPRVFRSPPMRGGACCRARRPPS